ncbi:MAG TPA: NYN domain-containing protein, partial [Candidatus Hydrogenedentes bacterium]|nr:NYN domain-containing protein [Candidatus Hydrogenedentota bacterium]
MAEHYLVDGYNVLHTSSVLRPLALRDFEAARESLVEKLVRFCSAANRAVTVVFDGRNTDGTRRAQGETRGVPGLVATSATASTGITNPDRDAIM